MSFVEDDDMIEALAADGSDKAFAVRILPGRPWRTHDFFDVHVVDAISKDRTVDGITITNQKSRHLIEWERFNDLLRGPLRRRMSGDVEVHDLSPVVAQDDESEQDAKRRRGDGKVVDRDDISNMVVQEGSPCRRGRFAKTDSVLVYRRLGDDVAEKREFGLDAWRSPQRILAGHALDQPSDLGFDPRASGFPLRLPSPEQLEALPMPSHHGVRLHDQQSGTPSCPDPKQNRLEDPITLAQTRGFRLLL